MSGEVARYDEVLEIDGVPVPPSATRQEVCACVFVCVCVCVCARAHTCTHTQSCTRALHHGQTIGTFNIANMVPCTERSCHAVTHARSKTCSSGKQDNASYCALVCVCTTCLLASPVHVILRYQGCWLNCCTVTCTPCW